VIEETGTVKSINGVLALVDIPRKSACEGCTAGACRPEEKTMEIEAVNQAGAVAGQRVRIAIKPYTYMKGSMLVYGVPAIALVLGAVFGKEVMGRLLRDLDPDILSAIFGFGALVVSFIVVKILTNVAGNKIGSKPVIKEILE
jgi:sigma-E factor negative regulatory protein RseC